LEGSISNNNLLATAKKQFQSSQHALL